MTWCICLFKHNIGNETYCYPISTNFDAALSPRRIEVIDVSTSCWVLSILQYFYPEKGFTDFSPGWFSWKAE